VSLRLMLVDDEPLARLRLRALIEAAPSLDADVVAEAADADEAIALLGRMTVDAVLLDIRMPGPNAATSGLRLAALLPALAQPPAVVFVTAHAEHALRAFDLDAVDYLTKPVRGDRLAAALQRVRQRLRPVTEPMPLEGPVLVVADRGRVLRLPVAEVLVLKAEQKYVTLRTAARSHLLDDSLTDLEQRLAALGGDFLRVHRNALVARPAIRELQLRWHEGDTQDEAGGEHWAVRVAPLDEWLAVSRRQVAAVRSALATGGGPQT
jgi:two-component system response regulator AlgR